jgi:hypothetical protein
MAHLAQRLGLDLADALAGDLELAPDFFERAAVTVDQPESLLEDLRFASVSVSSTSRSFP